MNVGFCIDGHLLSHKKKMNAKRNLYTKAIMISTYFVTSGTSVWNSGRGGTEKRMRDINKIVYHNVKVEETRMCNESS
jgi:hypothetical protein